MKKTLVMLAFICFAHVCRAQIFENFSDGNYTTAPDWVPDNPNNWTVANNQLRSNSATASSSFFISTAFNQSLNAQWDFLVQLQFNTSSANYVDVFLTSEQASLPGVNNNGYFVRIGGTPDEISLYKMTNGINTLIINGADGITNRSNNLLRIKVIRDANSIWSLVYDAAGGTNYIDGGTILDNSHITSGYFGFRVQQSTATFFNKHFFDDIYAGEIIVEKDPPVLETIDVISDVELRLNFNEPLDAASIQNPGNYSATNAIGNPVKAELLEGTKAVHLTFGSSFKNGISNQLAVSNIKDAVGNVMLPTTLSFLYFKPFPTKAKDIIITEILADPSPQAGLPEVEFIEIYNRSENPIDAGNWKLTDGTSTGTLPSQIILPNEYWIICSAANASIMNSFGKVLPLSNFPTLNNSADAIAFRSAADIAIDSVNYNLAWYKDEDKQEGGWSLERIDLNNLCGEEENWKASENNSGGTPGKVNSVNANKPDLTGPRLQSVAVTSSIELLLVFNEKLEAQLNTNWFKLNPAIEIMTASFTDKSLRSVRLILASALQPKILYLLEVRGIRDCPGNEITSEFNKITFAFPESATSGDLLLNEILFNPRTGGVDFVEVVNVSDKYLNLNNWQLGNYDATGIQNSRIITQQNILLAPGEIKVFTTDADALKNQYPNGKESTFHTMSLPSMNDDEGSVVLGSSEGIVTDQFVYSSSFHTPLLKDKEGVSLERISLGENTADPINWRSASSVSGYATPGNVNSNSRAEAALIDHAIIVEPEIFSPVVPGQDFAKINYQFEQGGLAANVKIVDHQGRIIKELANNETLASSGFFRWDGDRTDGSRASIGYYFVWFEVYDLDGKVNVLRKRVVVGK